MSTSELSQRFRRVKTIGEGAAGEVFEAITIQPCEYASTGDRVAIKAYKPTVLAQVGQATRVERELKASSLLESEHIVRSYEVIKNEDGIFLVMELLPGRTLVQFLHDNPLLSFEMICQVCQDLAEALRDLYSKGLIHRDVQQLFRTGDHGGKRLRVHHRWITQPVRTVADNYPGGATVDGLLWLRRGGGRGRGCLDT